MVTNTIPEIFEEKSEYFDFETFTNPTEQINSQPPPTSDPWARLNTVELDELALARHSIVTEHAGDHTLQIDSLRSRLVAHTKRQNFRRIAIASPTPGCGTSTVLANLALSLARLTTFKSMVFDFNLRNPSITKMLGLEQFGPEYSALLGTKRSFASTCVRVGANLGLSLNKTPIENPTEALFSEDTWDLISEIEVEYQPDLTLFDVPALTPYDDAIPVLEKVDAVLLVVGADKSKIEEVDRAERIISDHTNCLGLTLNRARFGGGTHRKTR